MSLYKKLFIYTVAVTVLFASSQGCLPGPTSMQVTSIVNCSSADKPVTRGMLDVSIVDSYYMKMQIMNMLTITANPAEFKAEVNIIDLKEVKVWFEYPKEFSLVNTGSTFPTLYLSQNPYSIPLLKSLVPRIQGDFLATGTASGAQDLTGEAVEFELIPSATTKVWALAVELKDASRVNSEAQIKSTPRFTVIAHIEIIGTTRTGKEVRSQEIVFPIDICKKCLDVREKDAKSSACSSSVSSTSTGRTCQGQDGVCLSAGKSN